MRLMFRPAFVASSRQRCSNLSSACSSALSFFNGWRSIPGMIPATNQLERLSSPTAMTVLSCARATRAFDLVDDAGTLADKFLALAGRSLGILLFECRDRRHVAMIRLGAQPADEGALQVIGIEPIRLRPAMLARDGNARSMDDIGLRRQCSKHG